MARAYNFCSGPAMLPTEVLQQAQQELLDFRGSGASIMEVSHRGDTFVEVYEQAVKDLRDLMRIPNDYEVLFLQGGATQQFFTIPMNLLSDGKVGNYLITGQWSKKAIAAAKKYGQVHVAASTEDENFTRAPRQDEIQLSDNAAYLHYTPNETIGGVEFDYIPQVDVPLIADMSSTILSRPIDVSKFGIIYAGAQKNIGPSGLVVMIIRKDLLGLVDGLPNVFDFAEVAKNDSMINTPPTFSIYLAGLVFKWLKRQGGVDAMAKVNQRKAEKLYQAIDGSHFFSNPIAPESRSWMNVPFVLADESLNSTFLTQAEDAGLLTLQGHRSVGGMRASIYNAMPEAGVDALIDFIHAFEKKYA
ncbi:3-phosphoserine/phosphohydroxythreonine transaminase [Salinibius halmophilus]|uniref:3-phosphoserine/phosphohydroxythreonine transaminase n=1 Tax=Salinibius halmophilus TaxID=1853216 RepID=UPI000E66A981|nr:3-phosphoserine/phosphohydroxythreonine transaminase [Salinibius halmophilus]